MKKIGLIGAGNIGDFLLRSLNQDLQVPDAKITAVYSRSGHATERLARQYQTQVFTEFDQFLAEDLDLVIEAATVEAVQDIAIPVIEKQIDLLLISVGALADEKLTQTLTELAKSKETSVYLPAGAIGGLDILKAAKSTGGLDAVSITTRKPPQAFSLDPIATEKVLFEGSAKEAIKKFPKNINVAVVLSLAGLGVEQTRVRIIADPKIQQNTHCIEAQGAFGQMQVTVENYPMPRNPKTSYLAALSILATLQNFQQAIRVG